MTYLDEQRACDASATPLCRLQQRIRTVRADTGAAVDDASGEPHRPIVEAATNETAPSDMADAWGETVCPWP
jgi:hypothetical protein